MDSCLSQDSLSSFIAPPDISEPTTPLPPHASLPTTEDVAAVARIQEMRVDDATSSGRPLHLTRNMTPPQSTHNMTPLQSTRNMTPPPTRAKTGTPPPAVSHISTPPPTDDAPAHSDRAVSSFVAAMTPEEIACATRDELRSKMHEVLPALHEARTSAAHYKLQYQMLLQESAAAMERMGVEMRMAQCETDVLQTAEQQRASSTPVQALPMQDPSIKSVHVDLYNAMLREIAALTSSTASLAADSQLQQKLIWQQESAIGSLSERVALLRDRIRENRAHLNRGKRTPSGTPRIPSYHAPGSQGFAALLHATEMASQEGVTAPTTPLHGHRRAAHSTSSLPSPPHARSAHYYQTPQRHPPHLTAPSTAPLPRTTSLHTPNLYAPPPPSDDGTVSAYSDSEAETDIAADDEVPASQASAAAAAMLKRDAAAEQREGFRAMLGGRGGSSSGGGLKQAKLFGAVAKHGIERGYRGPAAKRVRVGEGVGLGIEGVRE